LLPIANSAPSAKPEEEDRSCDKRDADAQKVAEPVITCNYFCFPYKNDDVYWVEKFYPDGTPCLFNFGPLESKCMNQDCHHPSSPIFNQTLDAPGGGGDGGEKKTENKEAGDGGEKKEEKEAAGNEEKNEEEKKADDGGEKKEENEEAGDAGAKKEEEKDGEAKGEDTNDA
ncbi:secreted protein, putative, partial [Ixodes scapularis]